MGNEIDRLKKLHEKTLRDSQRKNHIRCPRLPAKLRSWHPSTWKRKIMKRIAPSRFQAFQYNYMQEQRLASGILIKLIYGPIRKDQESLDRLILPMGRHFGIQYRGGAERRITYFGKVNPTGFELITEMCQQWKFETIGILTQRRDRFRGVFMAMNTYTGKYPREIRFYFWHKGDFEKTCEILTEYSSL